MMDRIWPARVREYKAAKNGMEAVQSRVHERSDRLLLDLLNLGARCSAVMRLPIGSLHMNAGQIVTALAARR